MFEFLFKYRPLVFERGELTLAAPGWALGLALLVIAAAVPLLLRYRRSGTALSPRDWWALGAVRFALLGVLVFCLFRPAIRISTVVPQRNFVAVLLDDSRSMRVADEEGAARGARLLELFGAPGDTSPAPAGPGAGGDESPEPPAPAGGSAASASGDGPMVASPPRSGEEGRIGRALAERFRVRYYRFAGDVDRVDASAGLRFAGERTGLADALGRVQQEMAGLPFSGIVLVTDGADNADRPVGETLLSLRASSVPVFTVGLGRERISPDLELRRVETPRRVLRGTTLVTDVILSHAGLSGRRARIDVEDAGRILGSSEVGLGPDGETPVQIQFTVEESGPRRVRFHVRPLEIEAVTENNTRETLIEVWEARQKILYFEGRPRPELAFMRRAVKDDENLQLVVLLRTADEKFLRLDVDDGEELAGGFPTTREELFRYDGLVLGDVEASFFTHDQLQMIADVVGQRGGGLLALGGRSALSEGGYAGTPLADALPVALEPPARPTDVVELRPELTPAGRRHPALRVSGDEASSAERWSTLPGVTSVNRVGRLKPGAVTLIAGEPVEGGESRLLLAHQRYGRGTAVVFPVQDSWLWQMHADIPLEDRTHETLWRQLLRWLVHEAPGRVRLDLPPESSPPGEALTIRAEVEDARYLRVNGAAVTAVVTGPSGVASEIPLEWTVEGDGEYAGRFVPDEPGLHSVTARAMVPGPGAAADTATLTGAGHLRVGGPEREPFDAGRRSTLLERISEETGGRSYTAAEVDALPEEIGYTETGDTVYEERPLWDMPFLFLLLVGLLTTEWGLRRWRGLA